MIKTKTLCASANCHTTAVRCLAHNPNFHEVSALILSILLNLNQQKSTIKNTCKITNKDTFLAHAAVPQHSLHTDRHLPSATRFNLLFMNAQVFLYLFLCSSRWQHKWEKEGTKELNIIFMVLLFRKPSFFEIQLSVIHN